MRAIRYAVALTAAISLAATGPAVRAGGPVQDMPVRLGAGGRTYVAVAPASVGYVLFTNVTVDVDRYPVAQIEVPAAKSRWRVHIGLHGESMTNVHSSGGSTLAALNLFGTMGWRGEKAIDVLVQLKDDIGVVRFNLAPEADKDVVFDAGKSPAAQAFGENAASPQCFVETGRKSKGIEANGLPPGRLLASSDKELGE
jgi:hypothetical protein